MHRIFKTLLITICLFSFLGGVKASTVSFKKLDGIYYNLTVDGNYTSGGSMFYLDGHLAYCIEPGVKINSKDYNSSFNWNVSSLTDYQKDMLEKIGYYGYEYPGHQTERYYIAAQELIWRTVKDVNIYWTTGKNGSGNVIDVSAEKNEILNLIKKHDMAPSFSSEVIRGKVGESLVLEDTNNVLSDYMIQDLGSHKAEIIDNKLNITFSEDAISEDLTLVRKNYDNETLIIYTNSDSQSLATLRLSSPKTISLSLESFKEEIPPTPTIVKVPSTAINDDLNHFLNKRIIKYNDKRFAY